MRVTPWDVSGTVAYEKLVKEFGVELIDDALLKKLEKLAGELHPFLRSRYFFAHRGLKETLTEYENGEKFFLYTGIAPSKSPMHMGHLIPFLFTQWLQQRFDVNVYIMIPDEEKFWAKKVHSLKELDERVRFTEKVLAAIPWDPDKTFLFRDREYIKHLYDAAVVVARKINFSLAKAVFGFSGETSIGLIFYPALQIVPTLFERGRPLIPCGIDQDPYFRIQRDIAESLGHKKAATILSKFAPALDSPEGKMSGSRPDSAILLTDDDETIRRKIMNAFTGGQPTAKEQREKGGNPDICSVYKLHLLLSPDEAEEIYHKCRAGELICGECKARLYEKVKQFMADFREGIKKSEKTLEKIKYSGKLAQKMWEWEFEYE